MVSTAGLPNTNGLASQPVGAGCRGPRERQWPLFRLADLASRIRWRGGLSSHTFCIHTFHRLHQNRRQRNARLSTGRRAHPRVAETTTFRTRPGAHTSKFTFPLSFSPRIRSHSSSPSAAAMPPAWSLAPRMRPLPSAAHQPPPAPGASSPTLPNALPDHLFGPPVCPL